MKKTIILFAVVAVSVLSLQAHAKKGWGMAGCGLGAMAFEKNEKGMQILAGIVNNIVSPQTFAITSGTSNCNEKGNSSAAKFITINRVALQQDISRGTGETLDSFGNILGCQDSDALGTALQRNFESIFSSDDSAEIHDNIQSVIVTNQVSCRVAS